MLSTETEESTTEDQLKPSPDHSHHIPYAQPQSQQDSDEEITFPCRKISWEVKGKRKRPKSIATRKTSTRPVKQKKFVDDYDEDEPLPKPFGKPPVKPKTPKDSYTNIDLPELPKLSTVSDEAILITPPKLKTEPKTPHKKSILKKKSKTPTLKPKIPLRATLKNLSPITLDDDNEDEEQPTPEISLIQDLDKAKVPPEKSPLPTPPLGTESNEVLQAILTGKRCELSESEFEPLSNEDEEDPDKVVKFETHLEIKTFESPDKPKNPNMDYPTKRVHRTYGFVDLKIAKARDTLARQDASPKAKEHALKNLQKYKHIKRILLRENENSWFEDEF